MQLREALVRQSPSLELQRSASAEIARLDTATSELHEQVQRLQCCLRQRDSLIDSLRNERDAAVARAEDLRNLFSKDRP